MTLNLVIVKFNIGHLKKSLFNLSGVMTLNSGHLVKHNSDRCGVAPYKMGEPILIFSLHIRKHLFWLMNGHIYLLYIILVQLSMSKEAAFWELELLININILIIIK
jgi:hypothetical protein